MMDPILHHKIIDNDHSMFFCSILFFVFAGKILEELTTAILIHKLNLKYHHFKAGTGENAHLLGLFLLVNDNGTQTSFMVRSR